MENLMTQSIKMQLQGMSEEFQLTEKDHGDLVVYDIFKKGQFLMTIAKDGSILFLNFDAPDADKEVFKLSFLNQFVEKIKSIS